jgi:ketosteroid isomerase-like protein
MSTIFELEQKIQVLEDIEAIKKLKAKYWSSVDAQQWEALADCCSEDMVFENPFFGRMEGRDYIIKVLKRAMRNVKTAHQGHNPDIDIVDNSSAQGTWALNDCVGQADQQFTRGYGRYEDDYVKENGAWKIKKSALTYVFQEKSA